MMTLTTRRLCFLLLGLHLFLVLIRPIEDPDLWWHLRHGQYMLQTFHVPRVDTYSYTTVGRAWFAPEWLSEAAMYLIYDLLGFGGLLVVFALISAAVFVWVARHSEAPAQIVLVAAVFAQAAALLVLRSPRPRLVTLAFSAVFFVLLRAYGDERRKQLWILPLLMLAWVNLHGGYPIGIVLILLAGAALLVGGKARQLPHLALILGLCLLAIPINPYGVLMFTYPLQNQFSAVRMSLITEWNAPNFQDRNSLLFLFLLLLIVTVLGLSKKRISWFDLLCLLFACTLSLRSERHVDFLSLFSIPILAEHSWNWISSTRYGQRITSGTHSPEGVFGLLLILAVLAIDLPATFPSFRHPVDLSKAPVAATQFMEQQNLKDNVFSKYEWNDYLIWNAPQRKVFIDGRVDMYGDEFLMEFFHLYTEGKDWEAEFNRYGVNTVLIEPSSKLAELIKQDPGWSEVYNDPQAIIFVRKQ